MRPRRAADAPDGLRERVRLKLAVLPGVTDEDVLEAVRPMRHPVYRRDRLIDRVADHERASDESGRRRPAVSPS